MSARSSKISAARMRTLVDAAREVLCEAIEAGGTTFNDFRQAGGSEGYFQRELRVYDRAGEPCVTCGGPIRRLVHAQRSSFWCRKCQRP